MKSAISLKKLTHKTEALRLKQPMFFWPRLVGPRSVGPRSVGHRKLSIQGKSRCAILLALITASLATGCGWVDSAGDESPTEIDRTNLVALFDNEVALILENSVIDATLADSSQADLVWQWTSTQITDSGVCDLVDGYDSAFAEESLLSACTDPSQCSFDVEPLNIGSDIGYRITAPELKASVALNFELTAVDTQGMSLNRTQSFCALSINEAPQLGDDELLILKQDVRVSLVGDSDAILANDTDDIDSRNLPLSIDLQTLQPPAYAAQFQLESNGSFVYSVDESLLPANQSSLMDEFTYHVTDGVHSVQTTTYLRIVDENQRPVGVQPLGVGNISVDDSSTPGVFTVSLNDYFSDPDGDKLFYHINQNSLPDGLSATISADGQLRLSATTPSIGEWLIRVSATDGLENINSSLYLIVEQAINTTNTPPSATNIPDHSVSGIFNYDIHAFFNDPDGDDLLFTSSALPPGVQITAGGIFEGSASANNLGSWLIAVQASDGRGASATDWFTLTIQ